MDSRQPQLLEKCNVPIQLINDQHGLPQGYDRRKTTSHAQGSRLAKSKKQLVPLRQNASAVVNPAHIYKHPTKPERRRRQLPPSSPSAFRHNRLPPKRTGKDSTKSPSQLESLPTEILEIIFLYTLALGTGSAFLNLPRSSVYLGRKLLSDYVRKELFIRICSDSQPSQTHRHHKASALNDVHARTQTWLLRQQWLTHDFIRSYIPDYLVSVLLRQSKKHRLKWPNHEKPDLHTNPETIIRSYILSLLKHNPPDTHYHEYHWDEQVPSRRHIILGLDPSTGSLSLVINENNTSPATSSKGLESSDFHGRWQMISLNPAAQIPNHLLHGPWTSAKMDLLELLIRGGASVDWVHTTAGEVAERGFYDAIQQNNARALRALCIFDNDTTPGEPKDASYAVIPSRGVGIIPSQEHLLLAIDQGCEPDILETLLTAPKSACDLQDVQVVRGIFEIEKRGWLERARWLVEKRDADRLRRNVRTGKKNRTQPKGFPSSQAYNPFWHGEFR